MQTWVFLGGTGDSRAIDGTGARARPDRHLEELALGHAHADLVLLVSPGGTLQEHGRHRDALDVDGNAVLGVQRDATVHALQEDVQVGAPHDVLALHTHALRAVHRDLIVGLYREALVDRRGDAIGLRDPHVDRLDAARQAEVREIGGEVGHPGTRILHLERLHLRHGGAVRQDA